MDTPNASLSLLRAGTYRIDVQQSGDTAVTVRPGEVEVTAGTSVFPLCLQQMAAITGLDSPASRSRALPLSIGGTVVPGTGSEGGPGRLGPVRPSGRDERSRRPGPVRWLEQ